jgi:homoserine kinase
MLNKEPSAVIRTDIAIAEAYASVANVGVGFDILGHAVAGASDRAEVCRIPGREVRIAAIDGCVTDLPLSAPDNTAGASLLSMLRGLDLPFGFELTLHKGIPLGSGMGGSAASCVAALVAANALLDEPLPREALYPFALDGELVASGSRHGDNIGPILIGGLVLVTERLLVRIPVPAAWVCVVVHPHMVLETRQARAALAGHYALDNFVVQSANLALVLAGCYRGSAALVRQGLSDVLIESRRAPLIPGFAQVKQAALDHDAMGAGISGAGPSVFGWFEARASAEAAAGDMRAAFKTAGYESDVLIAPIDGPAAKLCEHP